MLGGGPWEGGAAPLPSFPSCLAGDWGLQRDTGGQAPALLSLKGRCMCAPHLQACCSGGHHGVLIPGRGSQVTNQQKDPVLKAGFIVERCSTNSQL